MERDASFGHWVYSRRRELHLSRVELAAQVGCAAITLRKIEEDARRPSPQMAGLLAERLRLPPPARATFMRVARGELLVEHLPALPLASPDSPPAPASAVQRERIPTPLRTNLPAPLTSFVGRETELAEIAVAFADQRLVTLTGVGGVGKTRLCIEAGIRMVRGGSADIAPDGVWLVELAALAEPTLVAPAIVGLPPARAARPQRAGAAPGSPRRYAAPADPRQLRAPGRWLRRHRRAAPAALLAAAHPRHQP